MLKKKSIILLSLFASSLLFANETTKLDKITVSANKMEENIQNVPQSISVIDEEIIDNKGIKNISDVIKEIPNMNEQSSFNGVSSSFRGLNTSVFTNNNPIVIYIDGVPHYDRYDYDPSFANVEQIEVLRGPQGTIYGKDAIGAVINIKTKTPTNKWHGTLVTEYGNDNTFNTKLNTSGAIIDNKLFTGINGSLYNTDGWIENHYSHMDKNANKKNNRKISGFLLYKPTDNLSTKLTIVNNYSKKQFFDGMITDGTVSINNLKRDNAKNTNFDVPTTEKSKVNSQSLNLTYELEDIKFDSTTTHKKTNLDGDYDSDYTSNTNSDGLNQYNYTELETYTQEFKLSSKNQDIKWITGLYFDKESRKQGPYGQDLFYGGGIYSANVNSDANSKTYAAFGQTMIPFLEDFELTLGARLQKIEKDISGFVTTTWNGSFTGANGSFGKWKKSWNTFLPKVALAYKIDDNLTIYSSISKGYMPGGFNYFVNDLGNKNTNMFKPQTSINYEIGAKYIGDNFAINTAIFRTDIKDIHIYKIVGVNFTTDNAKKAHSQGIEFDGIYFLTENWSISGSLGLIQAKYDDYDNGKRKYNKEKIENTPNFTANLGVSYLANSGIYGRLDFNARGKTNYFDGANEKMVESNGAIISNAKIGYKLKNWDIYSYITNITNEEYVSTYQSKTGLALVGFNEPRRFGIGAIYKF